MDQIKKLQNIIKKIILIIISTVLVVYSIVCVVQMLNVTDVHPNYLTMILGLVFFALIYCISVNSLDDIFEEKMIWVFFKATGFAAGVVSFYCRSYVEEREGMITWGITQTTEVISHYLSSLITKKWKAIGLLVILLLVLGGYSFDKIQHSKSSQVIRCALISTPIVFINALAFAIIETSIPSSWQSQLGVVHVIALFVEIFAFYYSDLKDARVHRDTDDEPITEKNQKEESKKGFIRRYLGIKNNKKEYIVFGIGLLLILVSFLLGKIKAWGEIVQSFFDVEYVSSITEIGEYSDSYVAICYITNFLLGAIIAVLVEQLLGESENKVFISINSLLISFVVQVWVLDFLSKILISFFYGNTHTPIDGWLIARVTDLTHWISERGFLVQIFFILFALALGITILFVWGVFSGVIIALSLTYFA
ncbi:MAG: hypothetical protein J6113_06540, partial [Lachnospiraceae bacterium]|nr:hypothetical protein [Lachnospiraceae bacterium]